MKGCIEELNLRINIIHLWCVSLGTRVSTVGGKYFRSAAATGCLDDSNLPIKFVEFGVHPPRPQFQCWGVMICFCFEIGVSSRISSTLKLGLGVRG